MTKEFKTLIAPYIFQGKTFAPTLLTKLKDWPKIRVNDYMRYESIDCDNVGVVSFTDNSLTIKVGGEHEFHCKIVIALVGGKIIVESCQPGEYTANYTDEQMVEMFVGIEKGPIKEKPKSKWDWQMEIDRAIKHENFELAAKLRDEMEGKFGK